MRGKKTQRDKHREYNSTEAMAEEKMLRKGKEERAQ